MKRQGNNRSSIKDKMIHIILSRSKKCFGMKRNRNLMDVGRGRQRKSDKKDRNFIINYMYYESFTNKLVLISFLLLLYCFQSCQIDCRRMGTRRPAHEDRNRVNGIGRNETSLDDDYFVLEDNRNRSSSSISKSIPSLYQIIGKYI